MEFYFSHHRSKQKSHHQQKNLVLKFPFDLYLHDHDGDGCGSLQDTSCLCAATDIYVSKGGDVDDDDSSVFLGGIEFIDELDQDCDGEIRSIELASAYSIFEGGSIGDDNGHGISGF